MKASIACTLFVLTVVYACAARASDPPAEQTAFAANLEVADVPTASTLYGRMFHFNFRFFQSVTEGPGAGLLAKAMAAFNNSLMLGLSVRANNVIGSGSIDFDDEPVQALAKLKAISSPATKLDLAVGFDGMATEAQLEARRPGTYIAMPRGLYVVATKQADFAAMHIRLHGGASMMRVSRFDADRDVNVFLAVDGALTEQLSLGMEYDDILTEDGTANASINYAWDVGLRMDLNLLNLFRGFDAHHRVLKILYTF